MSEITPISRAIIVTPAAQTDRMRSILSQLCTLLDRALEPARHFKPEPGPLENDLKIAILMHALNAFDAACAVETMSGTDHPATIVGDFRTIFECLVKIRWMAAHPQRARTFLESEPFERYSLATARVRKSDKWPVIIAECNAALKKNPKLLTLIKNKKAGGHGAIAKAMRMPELFEMAQAVGMDEEDYLLDHAVPSLSPHSSIVQMKNYPRPNSDGTIRMTTEMDPQLLLAYVSRVTARTGEILQEVLRHFPDGKILFDSENVAKRLAEVTAMLRNSLRK